MPYVQLLKFLGLKRKKSRLEVRAEHLRKFVSYAPTPGIPPVADFSPERMRITWVIPDFMPGAGGHMTIFRIARYLEEFGHEVNFLVQNPTEHKTGEAAKATINAHFQPFNGTVELFSEETPHAQGDALIATDRFTCYPVEAMGGFIRKFYFVQDYEPAFYAAGAEALLSEATYHFDFDCLCAGEWLHKIMSEKYGRWSTSWPLAYDASVYNLGEGALEPAPRSGNRIALYARYVTSRRAVELAFLALEILHARGVQFEVDFFGWDLGNLTTRYPFVDHGVLGSAELADLYRKATLGVVFSATNHSLVNKEMMACGLPVVDLDLDTVRSIFPESTMAFARPTPEGIADTLEALLADADRRKGLQQGGLDFVKNLSWEKSARLVEAALIERVGQAAKGEPA
ncbi:glycosyltransferase family 4 protein [Roseibium suaedae]|uniref:Glycosyltransferase involved in cell wall bisynthesis n=1 Tax=Roseibium suaedae TaxID=735517 RepID=A0A1M7P850_9HYPH|nr:glycosyltransferase family 4 protein [Roseibium suaedae]SHN12593.1 Glycosyltransferase involved in cell wall bisynthesis [Roseibium suaedae]